MSLGYLLSRDFPISGSFFSLRTHHFKTTAPGGASSRDPRFNLCFVFFNWKGVVFLTQSLSRLGGKSSRDEAPWEVRGDG